MIFCSPESGQTKFGSSQVQPYKTEHESYVLKGTVLGRRGLRRPEVLDAVPSPGLFAHAIA